MRRRNGAYTQVTCQGQHLGTKSDVCDCLIRHALLSCRIDRARGQMQPIAAEGKHSQ